MTTATVRKDRLQGLDTDALIAQYNLAVSSHLGRYTDTGPRQKRIDFIVNLLADRADGGDARACRFFDEA